jgi:hypothetical protein
MGHPLEENSGCAICDLLKFYPGNREGQKISNQLERGQQGKTSAVDLQAA